MIGLRKKQTYDELINHLDMDPIKHYPDRRATQIENSNYMSQLAVGFQEMTNQNNRVLQERTKANILQELGHNSSISHRELQSLSGTNRPNGASSYDSISTLNHNVARPSFLPEQDRGLLAPLFSENYEEESRTRADRLHNILDDEHQDFNDTVRYATQPLIQRQELLERHYEDQLAFQAYENEQQREIHNQNLHYVRQQAHSMLGDIYEQRMHRMIEAPLAIGSGASSSSAAPMRMAIQDLTPIEPHSDSDEEELIPDNPIVIPSKLRPKEEEVRHLFKPKTERAKSVPRAHGEKIYHDKVADWQKESLAVLKEQLRFRPDIKLKKSEINAITKNHAILLLSSFDKQ